MANNFTNPDPSKIRDYKLYSGVLKSTIPAGTTDLGHNNISEVITTNVDHSLTVGKYKTEYFNSSNNLIKSVATDYSFSSYNNSNISLSRFQLPVFDYLSFVPFTGSVTVQDINSAFSISSTSHPTLFKDFDDMALNYMQYNDEPTITHATNSTPINVTKEALFPFSKIMIHSGFISPAPVTVGSLGTPGWYYRILNYPVPWAAYSGVGADTYVQNKVNGLYDFWSSHFSGSLGNFPPEFMQDKTFFIDGVNYKTHESYTLQPTHTKTITNFY